MTLLDIGEGGEELGIRLIVDLRIQFYESFRLVFVGDAKLLHDGLSPVKRIEFFPPRVR